jgi:ribosomal protein S18 acetylase RimI-like enzyme
LDAVAARRYLADPAVLHWIACHDEAVIGFLYCLVVPLRSGAGRELLLYEIGVRRAHRNRGVGRILLTTMEAWMQQNQVADVWVLADNPIAAAFYQACGFTIEHPQPTYFVRRVSTEPRDRPAEGKQRD